MELPVGTRLGPYEISGYIGAGAMGVVYRARDGRLGRDVAIKVLPPAFARDPDRLSRFEREARAVAAINHPNIVSVHDVGTADVLDADQKTASVTYLITELLDGDTLRGWLAQGPMSPRKAAFVVMQIARGLAAAHDRGIVHRDLKPENIVMLRDGHVKILDFGLAKQSIASGGSGDDRTMTSTEAGTVLGTVGYMAPEQVRGEVAGPRSDLFALGAVLFELVTGHRAFARDTAVETMTAILRDDPPEDATRSIPAALLRIVRHAIEKDLNDRFQSARDFAFALQSFHDASSSGSGAEATIDKSPARRKIQPRELGAWLLAGVLAVAAAAVFRWPGVRSAQDVGARVASATLPMVDGLLASPSVSPDGSRVAFIARSSSGESIVIRDLGSIQSRPLKGTNGVRVATVFWSPDGKSLGFLAGVKLKTIELATGRVEEIADAPSGFGGTWSPDGSTILFSPDVRSPIFQVNAKGGPATAVTTLDPFQKDEAHRWPQFLPDGRHFIFMPWRLGATTRTTRLASLDGGTPKALFDSESAAVVSGHYFLYVRDLPSHLFALPFDPKTFEPVGRPIQVLDDDNVDYFWPSGAPHVSANGPTLVYTTGKYRRSQLTWFDRTGRRIGAVGEPETFYDPALSPDGNSLAIERRDVEAGATDLWTADLQRGSFSRLTSSPGFESLPTWSPDARRIAYAGDQTQTSPPKLIIKNAGGTGTDERIVEGRVFPLDWSRDGQFLLYMVDGGATHSDIWLYEFGKKTSRALLASTFNENGARFSPDGKWIAFTSDEGHDKQVYVQSFPDGATKIQVSTAGGEQAQWSGNGRELFFLAPDTTLMSAELRSSGSSVSVGAIQPLFVTNAEPPRVLRNVFAASVDGQRFLVMVPVVPSSAPSLVAVFNWTSGLTRK